MNTIEQPKAISGDIVCIPGKEVGVVIGRSTRDGVSVMLARITNGPFGRYVSYEVVKLSPTEFKFGEIGLHISKYDYELIGKTDHGLVMLYF